MPMLQPAIRYSAIREPERAVHLVVFQSSDRPQCEPELGPKVYWRIDGFEGAQPEDQARFLKTQVDADIWPKGWGEVDGRTGVGLPTMVDFVQSRALEERRGLVEGGGDDAQLGGELGWVIGRARRIC